MNTTSRLTSHQSRVLAIVEAGGAHGVMWESIVREERAEGRWTNDIGNTVESLRRRGLIASESVITAEGINEWGQPYATRSRRYTVA